LTNPSDDIRQTKPTCSRDIATNPQSCLQSEATADRFQIKLTDGGTGTVLPVKEQGLSDKDVSGWAAEHVREIMKGTSSWSAARESDVEKDLRHTTSILSSNQIPDGIRETIAKDTALTPMTKELVGIYLGATNAEGGTDHRTDSQYSRLFDTAIKYKNLDAFAEIMSDPAARDAWQRVGKLHDLKEAFTGKDYERAADYVLYGKVSTAHQVSDSTGTIGWTTNHDSIQVALANMTAKENSDFTVGEHLLNPSIALDAPHSATLARMSSGERDDAKNYAAKLKTAMEKASSGKDDLEAMILTARGTGPHATIDLARSLNMYDSAFDQFDQIREKQYRARHGFAPWLANDVFGSPTRYQADDAINSYTSKFEQFSGSGTRATIAGMADKSAMAERATENALATNKATAEYVSDGIEIGAVSASIALTGGVDLPAADALLGKTLMKYGSRAGVASIGSTMARTSTKYAMLGQDYGGVEQLKRDVVDGTISGATFALGGDALFGAFRVGTKSANGLIDHALDRFPVNAVGANLLKAETRHVIRTSMLEGTTYVDAETFSKLADKALGNDLIANRSLAVEYTVGTINGGFHQPRAAISMFGSSILLRAGSGAMTGALEEGTRRAIDWNANKSTLSNFSDILSASGRGAAVDGASALVLAPVFSMAGRRLAGTVPFLNRVERPRASTSGAGIIDGDFWEINPTTVRPTSLAPATVRQAAH